MRPHPVNACIWERLQKLRGLEQRLVAIGLPGFLARVPYWLFSLQYCYEMEAKIARIRRISHRIRSWHDSMQTLCTREGAELELIDIGLGMRDDIESTKRTLADLREICMDVTRLFGGVGYSSRRLLRMEDDFVGLLSQSYETANALQSLLADHDRKALAMLRQQHDAAAAQERA